MTAEGSGRAGIEPSATRAPARNEYISARAITPRSERDSTDLSAKRSRLLSGYEPIALGRYRPGAAPAGVDIRLALRYAGRRLGADLRRLGRGGSLESPLAQLGVRAALAALAPLPAP